jgi:uncharacterized hydrophobic protein (TIGR00271 family)
MTTKIFPGETQTIDAQPKNKNLKIIRHFLNRIFKVQKITETRKAIVLNDLVDASSPDTDFFIMILFSSAIATFGLIANLSVVTIGAQLIDPLMSPILGLAVASLSGLHRMFNRSILAITKGAGTAIAVSAVISFFGFRLPNGINAHIPHEVMVRTVATPFDLGIAIIGGAAAAYALAHPRQGATLAGVAIATALVPPLCTIGFGVAFQNPTIILGASLQFLTNFVAITFSAISVFALLGFKPSDAKSSNTLSRSVIVSAIMMMIIAIPLAVLAWNSLSAARLNNRVSGMVVENLPVSVQAQLVDLSINSVGNEKEITVTLRMVRELTLPEAKFMQETIADQIEVPITLRIITMPMQVFE